MSRVAGDSGIPEYFAVVAVRSSHRSTCGATKIIEQMVDNVLVREEIVEVVCTWKPVHNFGRFQLAFPGHIPTLAADRAFLEVHVLQMSKGAATVVDIRTPHSRVCIHR